MPAVGTFSALLELAGSSKRGFARYGVVAVDQNGPAAPVVENDFRLADQVANPPALLGVQSKVSAPFRESGVVLTFRALIQNYLKTADRYLAITEHELSAGNIHTLLSLPDAR